MYRADDPSAAPTTAGPLQLLPEGGPGSTLVLMEQDTTAVLDPESSISASPAVEEELLIEEISIDGMCGVY